MVRWTLLLEDDIEDSRVESEKLMQKALENLKIKHSKFINIDKKENYLVFGSFSVAEKFLKEIKYNE